MKGMGKPFDRDLARAATEKTKELIVVLNKHLKQFKATLGPGRNSDIIIICKSNPQIKVLVEVEIVRKDRWEKIERGEYRTVRWPLAKREKCREYSNKGEILIMLSANEADLSKIFYIDCETWVNMGHEEKARYVRAGGKKYIYRKGQEEPFWAIEKDKVKWGIEGFEEFLLELLMRRELRCT